MRAHVWYLADYKNEDGSDAIDIFRYNVNFHNGPECMNCGLTFCHHCDPHLYDRPCPVPEA